MKCGIKNCAGLYFPEDANCCTNECGESEACINDDDGRCGGDDDNDGIGNNDGDDDNDMMVMAMQVPLGRNGTCISMCATHGGTAGGGECKFPFEYKGETERLARW